VTPPGSGAARLRVGRVAGARAAVAVALVVALMVTVGACAAAPPAAPVAPPRPAKTVQLNGPGEPVDVIAALPAGYVTVVDFWSESCKACVVLGGLLAVGVAQDPRIVIRKVDVGDGLTELARTYDITALPHFRIYDKLRRLRYDLVGADCERASEYARLLAAE
jgi:thiol-disulfide isomerase/thioredoxin